MLGMKTHFALITQHTVRKETFTLHSAVRTSNAVYAEFPLYYKIKTKFKTSQGLPRTAFAIFSDHQGDTKLHCYQPICTRMS